jgi:hypothetical protein
MASRTPINTLLATTSLALCVATSSLYGAKLNDSLKVVTDTNRSAEKSQLSVDELAMQAQTLLEEYRRLNNGIEYQTAYTRELEQLQNTQKEQLAGLQQQIDDALITQQRIVPLMRSMSEALEKFVVLDLPFHHEQRIGAVLQLKQRLQQPDLSVSARFRLLLEAYQLEQDYGTSIEAWRDPLQLDGVELSVEYLRIGRVGLYYLSLDGQKSGYWDTSQQSWIALESQHNQAIAEALRVARNQSAPQLLTLPMNIPGAAS